mmetsp:Transcript_9258/g.21041  ORF Transcript_9258/g.21041 Transcript_9258/m.21041 type:complete len:228 (-) Transcript_9258:7-690(-)
MIIRRKSVIHTERVADTMPLTMIIISGIMRMSLVILVRRRSRRSRRRVKVVRLFPTKVTLATLTKIEITHVSNTMRARRAVSKRNQVSRRASLLFRQARMRTHHSTRKKVQKKCSATWKWMGALTRRASVLRSKSTDIQTALSAMTKKVALSNHGDLAICPKMPLLRASLMLVGPPDPWPSCMILTVFRAFSLAFSSSSASCSDLTLGEADILPRLRLGSRAASIPP